MKKHQHKVLTRTLVVAAMFSLATLVQPLVATSAAAQVTWPTGSGIPEPIDQETGLPAYVPFDQVLSTTNIDGNTITGSSSTLLTNASGNNVGTQVTKKIEQSGSIWSVDTLNLKNSFHAKMNLYFGNELDPADGLAFAMTKDKPNKVNGNGGSLGVWGTDGKNATNALQKSFVVTFDTYRNGDSWDKNVVYPTQSGGQYVGWGFPGLLRNQYLWDTKTAIDPYVPVLQWNTNAADAGLSTADIGSGRTGQPGVGGNMALAADQSMTDGKWHSFTVDWVADSSHDGGGQLTFSFEAASGSVLTKTLTWTAADVNKAFGTTDVFWGFTGATGKNKEQGVVVFESIPGLVDANLATKVTDSAGNATGASVYQGTTLNQSYTLTYNGNDSKQSFPMPGNNVAATLDAQLQTGSNYGYVVGADGKVDVTVTLPGGTPQTVKGDPVTDPVETLTLAGKSVKVANRVKLTGLAGFDKAKGDGQTLKLSAPIVATTIGAADASTNAGVIIGNNAQYKGEVSVPAVIENPVELTVPYFQFGTLSVGQITKGVTGQPGQLVNAAGAADTTGIHTKFPLGKNYKLTAAVQSFNLGTGYTPGSAKINFTYNGKAFKLPDDGTAQNLFTNQTVAPDSKVTNVSLDLAAYPQIAANKTYKANIDWTLAVGP
ncbi:lectin-like domain-containing protein [Lacticaseibacillus nasuensis]|uniref:lectin-like domain-containing protein n=1 Tax=Lacticaseibacillus nasuensis TaxID=944671 RepID=UPI0022470CA4|nr:hypothetical protein [Lacticaseibacillus nasuensis]MCX2455297.1 hypothetical protein [Lacticaseibacillus nasuensis]